MKSRISAIEAERRQIRDGMSAVLCRCTGYQGIIEAVKAAAARMSSER